MTVVRLQQALVTRIQSDLERLWRFETPRGGHRAPRVLPGWMPPKRGHDTSEDPAGNPGAVSDDFPFVLVRPTSGEDTDEHARATVEVIVGVHSDDDDGHTDALLVVDLLRMSLQEQPIVDERFECLLPLTWALANDGTRPYWGAVLRTTWTLPRIVRVDGAA